MPLTAPGRVPNFPAKMHAILCRADLADIVSNLKIKHLATMAWNSFVSLDIHYLSFLQICWSDHGRSWKVLKPREFEIRVIPIYFEHTKFSSFVRQANGWGFRRITTGRDRNAYYHPHFLRGLPHLSKQMKRPGIAEKAASDPDHEPDLAKISEMYPIPLKSVEEEAILLPSTLRDGPKARMPVQSLSMMAAASRSSSNQQSHSPSDQESLKSFQQALGSDETSTHVSLAPQYHMKSETPLASSFQLIFMSNKSNSAQILAAANKLAWQAAGPSASSHMFAAGFAAAMAQNFASVQPHSNQEPHNSTIPHSK